LEVLMHSGLASRRSDGPHALDLCAGEGGFTRVLIKLGYKVTAMDSDGRIRNSDIHKAGLVELMEINRIPPFGLDWARDYDNFLLSLSVPRYGKYDLVVADGYSNNDSLNPSEVEYSPEHIWACTLNFLVAQLQMAKHFLGEGGSLVIKILGAPYTNAFYLFFDSLLAHFLRIVVVKPQASCVASHERYLCLIGFSSTPRKRDHHGLSYWFLRGSFEAMALTRRAQLESLLLHSVHRAIRASHVEVSNFVLSFNEVSDALSRVPSAPARDIPPSPMLVGDNLLIFGNVVTPLNSKSVLAHVAQKMAIPYPCYVGWEGPLGATTVTFALPEHGTLSAVSRFKGSKKKTQNDAALVLLADMVDKGICLAVIMLFF